MIIVIVVDITMSCITDTEKNYTLFWGGEAI